MKRRIRLAAAVFTLLTVVASDWALGQKIQIQGQIQINGRKVRVLQNAQGQFQAVAGGDADNSAANVDGVFLPPDRNAKRRLDSAKEMLEQKRYGEAVRYLGSLLEGAEDFFFKPDPTQQVYRSLKAEAGRLLGEMPTEGRESYELQFGARARRMLDEAIAQGDIGGVAEVSRRFFYTQAGEEATLILGKHYWDHGRALAAALCLDRLRSTTDASRFEPMMSVLAAASWRQVGESDRAKKILMELKERSPRAELQIGSQKVTLFGDESQALPWLAKQTGELPQVVRAGANEWTMYRGDAARNASTTGTLPLLNPRWRVRCADHPKVAEAVNQLERAYRDQNIAAIPSAHPLAVGNVVLMRTTRKLQAVDFVTGKRIWEAPPAGALLAGEDSLDQLLAVSSNRQQLGLPAELLTAIDQRVWSDAPFGTLSSDGENVFMIEDLGFATPVMNTRRVVRFNGQVQMAANGPNDHNRLSARELKTEGKLKWEIGGPDGEDEPKLAGAFFLGPPLPILGRLYAIAEMKGQEIRLVALSAETGKVEWSQQLAVVEDGVLMDPFRRDAGAVPSFSDGILVCPTSAGAIVAVDLATRSLLWGFQYPRGTDDGDEMGRLQMFRARMFNQTERRGHDQWVDASATVVSGKVLVTPIESNTLYCLNLIDGSVLWKQERGTNLYVAGVHNGNVILVGRQAMTAVKLADGQPAWERPLDLSSDAAPSGRGFMSGDDYFLPLSSAEVVQVNLKKGAIASRAKSRRGDVPGNLICFHGEVVSQGTGFLESFYQLDALKNEVAERLKANANDSEAMVRLGEINFDAGNIDEATRLFRRAHELSPDDMTTDLLVESLLAGLREDFAKHRDSVPELEKLIVRKSQRLQFLRLLAAGQQAAGEPLAALDAYLRIADLDAASKKAPERADDEENKDADLDEVADGQLVKRDRWLRARLTALRGGAADKQGEIDRVLGERISAIASKGSVDELRRWIDIGGTHPLVDKCRVALVTRLGGPETMLEREWLLMKLAIAVDKSHHSAALVKLTKLYTEAKQPELAAKSYRRLAGEWADTIVSDGKTGKQLLEAIADESVKEALVAARPWPVGFVESRDDKPRKSLPGNRYQRPVDLAWSGSPGPFFDDAQVLLERQNSLLCVDGLGNERFKITVGDPNARRNFVAFNAPQLSTVCADGHVLVYSQGSQLMAFDTLRPPGPSTKPVWTLELSEQFTGMNGGVGLHPRPVIIAWGENRLVAQDSLGRPVGAMGQVLGESVIVQRMRDLLCLDSRTGQVLWQRRNAPQGCEVFGDDELLIAAPMDGGEALVLKTLDGELLGNCRVAPLEQRMATIGRLMLTWQADGGRSTMSLVDPWKSDTLWTQHFEANSKAAVVRDEAVGVLEPNGKFSLFKLPSGERVIHEQLEKHKLAADSSLTGIIILRSADQYLLVTNSQPRAIDQRVQIQPAPGGSNNPLINGRVYAFNRKTYEKMWPAAVRLQNHGLLLSQPSQLPVLVFMRSLHRNVAGNHEARTSMLVIDKRSGRTAYKNDDLKVNINNNIGNAEFVGDRGEGTVSLLMPGKTITLTCTDKPWPPEEPVTQSKPKQPGTQVGRAVEGIFRALENTARGIGGLPTVEEEEDPFGLNEAQQDDAEGEAGKADEARRAAEEAAPQAAEAADAIEAEPEIQIIEEQQIQLPEQVEDNFGDE